MPQVPASSASLLPVGVTYDTLVACDTDCDALVDSPRKLAFPIFTQNRNHNISSARKATESNLLFEPLSSMATKLSVQKGNIFPELQQFSLGVSCNNVDLHKVQLMHAELDEGALYVPTSEVVQARSVTPTTVLNQVDSSVDNSAIVCEVTPSKPLQDENSLDPLTPTANLKVLISAVSPELRYREKMLRMESNRHEDETADEFDVQEDDLALPMEKIKKLTKKKTPQIPLDDSDEEELAEDQQSLTAFPQPAIGRKEKSLGLLCFR